MLKPEKALGRSKTLYKLDHCRQNSARRIWKTLNSLFFGSALAYYEILELLACKVKIGRVIKYRIMRSVHFMSFNSFSTEECAKIKQSIIQLKAFSTFSFVFMYFYY